MDKMDKALDQNILDNIRPHWRNHASLKGKLHLYFHNYYRLELHELSYNHDEPPSSEKAFERRKGGTNGLN